MLLGIVMLPLFVGARVAFAWFRHHRLSATFSHGRLTVGGWLDPRYLAIEALRNDRDDSYRPTVFFVAPRQTSRGQLSKVDRVEAAAINAGFEVKRRPGPIDAWLVR